MNASREAGLLAHGTSGSMFSDDLTFVQPSRREPGPVTGGQVRKKAFTAQSLSVGHFDITARDEPGGWHRLADYDRVGYLVSGRCRIDCGAEGEASQMATERGDDG